MPYMIDRRTAGCVEEEMPRLQDMMKLGLERFEKEDHFFLIFLMIKDGRIDHAAATYETIAFDQALRLALEFQSRHPDTLVVATTDHGKSNICKPRFDKGFALRIRQERQRGRKLQRFPPKKDGSEKPSPQ